MACGCAARKTSFKTATATVAKVPDLPHEVRPGESCIFCAEKHLSLAHTRLCTTSALYPVIGELELARRHTLLEYADASKSIAEAEFLACIRDRRGLVAELPHALELVRNIVETTDPERHVGKSMDTAKVPSVVVNPFVGEIHMHAAHRLAFEVGYMLENRAMIIGDLALAREYLVRFDHNLDAMTRELRHRVQTMRAADLNGDWQSACEAAARLVEKNLKDFKQRYSDGLRTYLGLQSQSIGETR